MVGLFSLLLAATAVVGGLAAPTPDSSILPRQQSVPPNSRGFHDGFYYFWWSDGGSPATYKNLMGGSYSLEWKTGGNLLGGKGWENGTETRYGSLFNPCSLTLARRTKVHLAF